MHLPLLSRGSAGEQLGRGSRQLSGIALATRQLGCSPDEHSGERHPQAVLQSEAWKRISELPGAVLRNHPPVIQTPVCPLEPVFHLPFTVKFHSENMKVQNNLFVGKLLPLFTAVPARSNPLYPFSHRRCWRDRQGRRLFVGREGSAGRLVRHPLQRQGRCCRARSRRQLPLRASRHHRL